MTHFELPISQIMASRAQGVVVVQRDGQRAPLGRHNVTVQGGTMHLTIPPQTGGLGFVTVTRVTTVTVTQRTSPRTGSERRYDSALRAGRSEASLRRRREWREFMQPTGTRHFAQGSPRIKRTAQGRGRVYLFSSGVSWVLLALRIWLSHPGV